MGYRKTIFLFYITDCIILLNCVHGFNLSPKPNYIFKEPNLKTFFPKIQSSYFGYSINLRPSSLMVGAPRAQSSLETQRMINESGAIYKCSFLSSTCEPFVLDNVGNTNNRRSMHTHLHDSEKKDHQWLGASMDGNQVDGERFVVCAPRMITDLANYYPYSHTFLLHGLCYLAPNTTEPAPRYVQTISKSFRDKQKQYTRSNYYYYMYGEQGISVHVTVNDQEILIGAPGVFEWKGTVIRYKTNNPDYHVDARIDVPNPAYWNQGDDSYFGYALASGYFQGNGSQKILYVASAPQANLQQGEVYIFDIVDFARFSTEKTIKIYHTFSSSQMGEYFGYALVADDFNGDGFYDLAISAPFHSKENSYENGAVYIYQNLGESVPGNWSSNFVLQSVLSSDYESNGRFGSSISKLGDINRDGFNDIAVGAPFEDNGAVYIYFGSSKGINSSPSQRLEAPYNPSARFTPQMFGHSLSKGSDIDRNSYLDLAVGAPNSEAVYVYRSYPIVKLNGTVYPLSKELRTNDTSLKFRICWSLKSKILNQTRINIMVTLDQPFNRVSFSDKSNRLEFNTTAYCTLQCRDYDAIVTFSAAHIFKPITIEMLYTVVDAVPENNVFCSECVAVDPTDSNVAVEEIAFITGCVHSKCVADLKLSSRVLSPLPYIKGSTNNITFEYKVENFGEVAYLPQINISYTELVSFMKIPSSCERQLANDTKLLCNINLGSPLSKGDVGFFNVSLDTTNLEETELLVKANVISTGNESNDEDNHANDVIPIAEFSCVEISGKSNKQSLNTIHKLENVLYTYEIRNNGPTYLKHVDVVLSIPISYQKSSTLTRFDVIPFQNITVKVEVNENQSLYKYSNNQIPQSQYNNQLLQIEWSDQNITLVQNPIESSTQSVRRLVSDVASWTLARHTRNTTAEYDQTSNRCTKSLPEDAITHRNDHDDINLKGKMISRTILFDCYNSTTTLCVRAKFSVNNFWAGNDPMLIQLNFSVHLHVIDKFLTDNLDTFVIRPSIELELPSDDKDREKMHVEQSYAYTVIWKQITAGIAIWIYIVSGLVGLLAFILLTFALYKFGFFVREKKDELKVLVRQSQRAVPSEAVADK